MNLTVYSRPVSEMSTNCYIVFEKDSGRAFLVDPGKMTEQLEAKIKKLFSLYGTQSFDYILLTHGHFDHIGGVVRAKELFGGKIVIGKKDEVFFTDGKLSLSSWFDCDDVYPEKADITVCDGEKISFAEGFVTVIETPGHTGGGVCYLIENVLFTGDTLFCDSTGRTDFPTGNQSQLFESLKKLAALDGDFEVYPGHGISTTLDRERLHNPYINF